MNEQRIEAALARLTGYRRQVQVDLQPWWGRERPDDQDKSQIEL